ncbi:MAG TPA: HAMP domain-containing sensor histidine kinase, partial [Minicystis sp.]|nr:HAMP domain-containing sensor histidine kinase [Minicystis sp.]
GFEAVCGAHEHAVPTEAFSRLDETARELEICRLQQRARALETEVGRREALEIELREALEQRRHVEAALRDALERERAARHEAERAVRFNELFAGTLGHDLRNPLNAIVAGAQLLVRHERGDGVSRTATRMLSSADRMARMVDQLLDLTRVRVGNGLPLKVRSMDAAELCVRVKEELEASQPSRRVDVAHVGDPRGDWDPDRLLQVLSNLVGNALSHGAADAPVTVRIDGTRPDEVSFSVHNDGAIPAAVSPVVFEPFRGADKHARSNGLGLGLYISQQITAAHGGTIGFSSDEAAGTTFVVRLPRRAC